MLPLGSSGFEFYAKVGVGSIVWDYSSSFGDDNDEDVEVVVTGGIGARYTPIPELTLILGIDSYVWEQEVFNDDYDMSIEVAKFGMQYNF